MSHSPVTRPTTDGDRRRIKGATERSIKLAGGGTVTAAQTRVGMAALSKYAAPQEVDSFMPIDVALDCDMLAGQPIILTAMAITLGFTLSPIPSDDPAPCLSTELTSHIARECGEAQAAILDALGSGDLSFNARQAAAKEIDEAMAALWKARAALRGE